MDEDFSYWSGTYFDQGGMCGRNWIVEELKDHPEFVKIDGGDLTFDIQRSKCVEHMVYDPKGNPVLLPISGLTDKQRIDFRTGEKDLEGIVPKWMFNFFRVDEKVAIHSDTAFIMGKPIRLGHSTSRRKFVLNILIDALCWPRCKETSYCHVPELVKFFQKGVIFNQHYSVMEYTYPSLATIETGMYPHHSQIFNQNSAIELNPRYKTISEQMRDLGYYTVNLMGDGAGIYNGVTRGYDRLIVNGYVMPAYEGVERTIRQLKAFQECDQFIFFHIADVHPWNANNFQVLPETQTGLSLEDRVSGFQMDKASVYIGYTPFHVQENENAMENTQRCLRYLFDYIETHYSEDEYIVQVYSDYGVSVYDKEPYLLSEHHLGSAWMLRGAGIPEIGFVEDEMTSAIDIYSTMGKLAGFSVPEYVDGNLPAIFGGEKRKYVISNSMFPGQTYKLCIRDRNYECQMVTEDKLFIDGMADMSRRELHIYSRNEVREEVFDPEVRNYFESIIREHTKTFDHEGMRWTEKEDYSQLLSVWPSVKSQ